MQLRHARSHASTHGALHAPHGHVLLRWTVAFLLLLISAALAAAGLAFTSLAEPALPAASGSSARNVYAAGADVQPAHPVRGDLMAAGGRVLVKQPVGGDATLAGGSVEVRARVGDDLRAVGGSVTADASVGGDLFAAGGQVDLRPSAAVEGSAALHAGTVTIGGRIEGDLKATAQKILVNGELHGATHLVGERVELGPQAKITGALSYASPAEIIRAEGATVQGPVTREAWSSGAGPEQQRQSPGAGFGGPGFLVSYLSLLACAAAFVLVAPAFSHEAPEQLRASPWRALAAGLGTLVALPLLAVLLFVTLLGIPLGLALMALFPVLLLGGFVVGVLLLAGLVAAGLRGPAPETLRGRLGYLALALLMVLLLGRVPFAGPVLLALASIGGLGAAVLQLRARRTPPGAAPGQAAVSLPPGGGVSPA